MKKKEWFTVKLGNMSMVFLLNMLAAQGIMPPDLFVERTTVYYFADSQLPNFA